MAANLLEKPLPKIGLVVPSKELSLADNYHQGLSSLGYFLQRGFIPDWPGAFAAVYHHTILHSEWRPHSQPRRGETRYKSATPFPDPFTILNMLARLTTHTELFTAVLVSPQMQTAHLAQQIAMIANLSGGRFTAGFGVGWNASEYAALGMEDRFGIRGKILNQQIPAIRLLLKGEPLTTKIEKENFVKMAINPHSQYEVPFWFGGQSEAALKRAAQYGEGWMPLGDVDQFKIQVEILGKFLSDEGKDLTEFGTMGRIALGKTPKDQWVNNFLDWCEAGATHVALTTTGEEDDYDPEGEKADPYHHLALTNEFFRLTRWLQTPSGTFRNLFKCEDQAEKLELPEGLNDLLYIQLDKSLETAHIAMFLLSRQFSKQSGESLLIKTSETGEELRSDSTQYIGPKNERVIFFRSENTSRTYVLYSRSLELFF